MNISLLPIPRHVEYTGKMFQAPEKGLIALSSLEPQALFATACALQKELRQVAGLPLDIVAGMSAPANQIAIALIVLPGSISHEQGYNLTITHQRIDLVADTPRGLFYAIQTLRQLVQQTGATLPTLRITDWPDFPNRGVMLDISRDKVPDMKTLYGLVDLFACLKINQLQLYTEHTFTYRNHPVVWAEASPMTGEEILALDDYCRERFIELVPNQNTFGHMRQWLIHDEYRHLAECPDGCDTRWGHFDEPFSLAPSEPGSLDLVYSLLDELLPHFRSKQVNVGGDEPVDLDMAQGRSGKMIKELGVERVYLDYLMKIYRAVKSRGRTMQFWGDIIMEHPELTPELPRDLIALEWGYEADHHFDQHGAIFATSGIPFYTCPGTSSWRSLGGRTDNARENLRNAAFNGRKHGAAGYLITDWGDDGHWQPLPVSYLGFTYGAALAWSYDDNVALNIPEALDVHVFRDSQRIVGKIIYDLGNVYQMPGILMHNSSALFNLLQADQATIHQYLQAISDLPHLSRRFQATLEGINEIMKSLSLAEMQRTDARLIQSEFAWVADMLRHACRRGQWAIGNELGENVSSLEKSLEEDARRLILEFRKVWHARNRPGGFIDSLKRMEKIREAYRLY
jgi:hexosaminidase